MTRHAEMITSHGLNIAVQALLGDADLFEKLKIILRSAEAYSIAGESIPFMEEEARQILDLLAIRIAAASQPITAGKRPIGLIGDDDRENGQATDLCSKIGGNEKMDEEMSQDPLQHTLIQGEFRSETALDIHDGHQAGNSQIIDSIRIRAEIKKLSSETSFENMTIVTARFEGKDLVANSAQTLIENMIYPLLLRKSKDVSEDLDFIREHTGLEARKSLNGPSPRYKKSSLTGLYLPTVSNDQAIRSAAKIARVLGDRFEVDVLTEGRASKRTYYYDPGEALRQDSTDTDEIMTCGAGRFFRFKYLDTQECRSFFIRGSQLDKVNVPSEIEVIGDGQPIAQAVEGYGAGDRVSLDIRGSGQREVMVLEVW